MRIVPGQLPVQFNRKFHLADYEVAHAQVLFRSGKTAYHQGDYLEYNSVADVLFKNVAALAVMENYPSLEISMGEEGDINSFRQILECQIGSRSLYVLRGEGSVGYVLAGALYWADDENGTIEEPSALIAESNRSKDIEVMRASEPVEPLARGARQELYGPAR